MSSEISEVANLGEAGLKISELQELIQSRDAELLLAAEIGENLLAQNRELSKQVESLKSEVAKLSSEVETSRKECRIREIQLCEEARVAEARVQELQSDLTDCRLKLHHAVDCLADFGRYILIEMCKIFVVGTWLMEKTLDLMIVKL